MIDYQYIYSDNGAELEPFDYEPEDDADSELDGLAESPYEFRPQCD